MSPLPNYNSALPSPLVLSSRVGPPGPVAPPPTQTSSAPPPPPSHPHALFSWLPGQCLTKPSFHQFPQKQVLAQWLLPSALKEKVSEVHGNSGGQSQGCPSVVLRLWHKRRLICCRCFPRRGGKEGGHILGRNRPCDINLRVAESSFSDVLDVQCFAYVEWHMFYVCGCMTKKARTKALAMYQMWLWLFDAGIHLILHTIPGLFCLPHSSELKSRDWVLAAK